MVDDLFEKTMFSPSKTFRLQGVPYSPIMSYQYCTSAECQARYDGVDPMETVEYAGLDAADGEAIKEPEPDEFRDSVWRTRESSAKLRDNAIVALHICVRLQLHTTRH